MKISAIASICKAAKAVSIVDVTSEGGCICQWIGDGRALYPVYNMPYLNKSSVFILLDVPEDKRDEYSFHHITDNEQLMEMLDDTYEREQDATLNGFIMIWEGDTIRHVFNDNGLMMFSAQYLKPFREEKGMLDFYERTLLSGSRYIAVKTGLLLKAIIYPIDIYDGEFVSALKRFANRCENELIRQDRDMA